MRGVEDVAAFEVGQRTRHATHAIETTRGESHPRACCEQHPPGVAVRRGMAIQLRRPHSRVAARSLGPEALVLTRPRGDDAFADDCRAVTRGRPPERRQLDRRDINDQVEAIQERP